MLLLERLLVAGAQVDHPRHVGFVEGGQDRGGLLGLDQALGDLLAEPAHALAGLARPAGRTGGRGRGGRRSLAGGARRGRRSPAGAVARRFEVGQHVSLGDPAAGPGGGDPGDVDALLGDQPADGRRERSIAVLRRRRPAPPRPGLRRGRAPLGRCGGRAARPAPALGRAAGGPAGSIVPTVAPIGDRLAFGDADLQDARARRRHDAAGLVGLELEQRLAGLDRVDRRP